MLGRIIDEDCDIMQKRFRFHQSNCPQLKGRLSEESEHTFEKLKAELRVLTFKHKQWTIKSFHMQFESTICGLSMAEFD